MKAQELTQDDVYIDFTVPNVSAFSIFDKTPQDIIRPGSVKEFALQVGNIFGSDGSFSPGIALEFSPWMVVNKHNKFDINSSYNYLRGLQFTLGTLQDSTGAKAALGLKWTIIDQTAPETDESFKSEVRKLLQKDINDGLPPTETQNKTEKLTKVLQTIGVKQNIIDLVSNDLFINGWHTITMDTNIDESYYRYANAKSVYKIITDRLSDNGIKITNKSDEDALISFCDEYANKTLSYLSKFEKRKQAYSTSFAKLIKISRKERWNKEVFGFGLGMLMQGAKPQTDSLHFNKFVGYLTGAYPIGNFSQLQLMLQYQAFSDTNAQGQKSIFNVGVQFTVGSNEFRTLLQCMYSKFGFENNDAHTKLTNDLRLVLGIETKVSSDLWFTWQIGTQGEASEFSKSKFVTNYGLKYAFNKEK